jgi:putative transposase
MLKGYKYRICPTEQQKIKIAKHIGCYRWVYNWGLDRKMREWNNNHKNISKFDLCNELPLLKKQKETEWLKEIDSQVLQQALENLDSAYVRFFKEKKGFPKFKSKRKGKQSFRIPQRIKINEDMTILDLPKFREGIKIVKDRKFKGTIKNITITKTTTNKYYATILVDTLDLPKKCKLIKADTTIGLDLGIKDFVVLSTGEKISNPKFSRSVDKRMARLQRAVNRKVKGSKNREKTKLKVALLHEGIANKRNDFLHKLSHRLTHENQVNSIAIEDLNVSGMMKNHKLARSIGDCSWYEFLRQLTYKSEWYGINLIKIGRFEPSSKLCSNCGAINQELTLKDREWTCKSCGAKHDRDINAAINIKNIAMHPQNRVTVDSRELTLGETSRCKDGLRTKKLSSLK